MLFPTQTPETQEKAAERAEAAERGGVALRF